MKKSFYLVNAIGVISGITVFLPISTAIKVGVLTVIVIGLLLTITVDKKDD